MNRTGFSRCGPSRHVLPKNWGTSRLSPYFPIFPNQWIAATVAEKVGVVETAADYFKKRAGKATGTGLMKFLRNAPKVAPDPEDAMR